MSIIKVENLGKKYIIGHDKAANRAYHYYSLRESLAHHARGVYQRLRHPLTPNRENTELEEFWALKDINFEIEQGDRIGIIGRNGAGKSTLLKILSRITEPTNGKITMHGRVASLLEVGTGFHPELTGRENIYLNGAILGMTRVEIKKKFDEIVAFAEVEKFLDTPVKRYSSGMYVRLAFAVAAHLEPEILLVDEVLAVGDAQFQKKCLGKMEDVSKEGRTVLFVSHNMAAVSSLCRRAIVIAAGRIVDDGTADEVITNYVSEVGELGTEWNGNAGNDLLTLQRSWIKPVDPQKGFTTSNSFKVGIEYNVKQPLANLIRGVSILRPDESPLCSILFDDLQPIDTNPVPSGYYRHEIIIPPDMLSKGGYIFEFDLGIHNVKRIIHHEGRLFIRLDNVNGIGKKYELNCDARNSVFRPRIFLGEENK